LSSPDAGGPVVSSFSRESLLQPVPRQEDALSCPSFLSSTSAMNPETRHAMNTAPIYASVRNEQGASRIEDSESSYGDDEEEFVPFGLETRRQKKRKWGGPRAAEVPSLRQQTAFLEGGPQAVPVVEGGRGGEEYSSNWESDSSQQSDREE
jgi:hypothetical protein